MITYSTPAGWEASEFHEYFFGTGTLVMPSIESCQWRPKLGMLWPSKRVGSKIYPPQTRVCPLEMRHWRREQQHQQYNTTAHNVVDLLRVDHALRIDLDTLTL